MNDERELNVELLYLAEDVRLLNKGALDAREKLRLKVTPFNTLCFRASLEKLALGLIGTARYKPSELKSIIKGVDKADVNGLYDLHAQLVELISREKLFRRTATKVERI